MIAKLLNFLAHLLGYVPRWLELPASFYERYAEYKAKQTVKRWLEESNGQVRKVEPDDITATTRRNSAGKNWDSPLK